MDTKLNNNIKLGEISTQYSKFDKNQVLTETQLNGFLDYFDDQDRLSRTSLSGVGIVCGFKLNYAVQETQVKRETKREFRLNITQGRGVTTDGDLLALQKELAVKEGRDDETLKSINLPSKTYGYCKTYTDDNANYEHFIDEDEKQIPLWELYEVQDENDSLTRIQDLPNIEEMVVLLYLENYSKDQGLCTKLSCDNQGIPQVAKLKVLLVSLDDAEYIISKDNIYKQHDWYKTYTNLPEVQVKRVVLTCENTKTYKKLKENYYNAIKSNNTLEDLAEGLNSIFTKFQITSITPRITGIFNFSSNVMPFDFQYRYDVLKDIIDTYNEIKELLLHLNVDCCPQIGSFPKHLLLGKIKEKAAYLSFRHQFYKSPIIGHDNENYQKVISLLKRVKELAFNYRFSNKGEVIKITPSRVCGELQNRAVPFYYNVNESLLTQWSFSKTNNLKQKFNLSYHTQNLANVTSIRRPLEYSLDCFNFYRIEGHQGKMYREALESIFKIREEKGLNFDVKALSINTGSGSIDISKYKCQFEDLSVLLSAWKAEQSCVLSEISTFLSGFSTAQAGTNVVSVHNGYEPGNYTTAGADVMMNPATDIANLLTEARDIRSEMEARRESVYESRELTKYSATNIYNTQKDLQRKNIVEEGLTTEKGTIGEFLEIAFLENKEGSVNDILAYFNNSILDIKAEEHWAAEEELTDFVFNDVPQILVHTYLLDDKTPATILQIDDITLSNYQLTIDQLCRYVKTLQTKYQSIKIQDGSKQILGLLINQLSTVCCSGKKLELLLTEIEKRKKEILIQIQLSEFVKANPGLEHKAGVEPGGTFVMVYLSENEQDKNAYEDVLLELDFLEQPNIDDDGLDGDEGILQLWNDKVSTRFAFLHRVNNNTQNPLREIVIIGKTIEETVTNFADFLNNIWTNTGEKSVKAKAEGEKLTIVIRGKSIQRNRHFIQFYNPSIVGKNQKIFFDENSLITNNRNIKNKVVADFCLPFMFKSDCAPINFIIPKEPIFLRLPQPFVCLKEDDEFAPLLFEKSDENLEIKAKVLEGVESGLTKNEKGEDVFDARLTDESLYGIVIEFTLGDEETGCVVTVYPDVALSVTTDVSYNNTKTIATVIYKVSEIIPNLIYAWDFGKGNISDQKPDEKGEIKREYQLPFNQENRINPKLIISNGFCEKEILIESIEFEIPVDASLTIEENYCLDTKVRDQIKIPFTNQNPTDGKIEIVGGEINGLEIENGFLIITPQDFNEFEKEIRFTIEGLTTNAKIIIKPKVTIEILSGVNGGFGRQGDFNWVGEALHYGYNLSVNLPENSNEGELTFEWALNEKSVSNESSYNPNFLLKEESQDFIVKVTVTHSNGCGSETDMFIQVQQYPVFTIQLPNNKIEYCLNDDNLYAITINPNIENTVVSGLGVSVNANEQPQFTPSATGLDSAGTTPLSIAGKQLLMLTLKDVPKASFTTKIEEKELVITNTSDLADKYIWNIGGLELTRTNRATIRRSVDLFETSEIDITLRTEGLCGEDTFEMNNVKVREENNTICIDAIKLNIKNDRSKLSVNIDVSQEILDNVVNLTISTYDTILIGTNEVFEGANNAAVLQETIRLLSETEKYMLNNIQSTFVFSELSKFYIAQAKLIFNILHCQSHTVLEKDKRIINVATSQMRLSFRKFKERDLVFDTENDLKEYLNVYSNDPQVIAYIKQIIKDVLIPEIV